MSEAEHEAVDSRQYLTFVSAGQTFGIPIMRMKEIVPYGGCTRVPLAPGPIAGLINLRGRAIPVVDLSVRFGFERTPATRRSCVLIVDLADRDRPEMGILADSVSQVMDVGADALEAVPAFGTGVSTAYLKEMVRWDGDFIPIVDIEEVLDIQTAELAAAAARPEAAGPRDGPAAGERAPDVG